MPSAPAAESPAPAFLSVPPRAASIGDIAIDLADAAGLVLDDHQRCAIDALQSIGADGSWAMLEGCVIEPRQNGKSGGILLPIVLAHAIFVPDQLIVWSAHRYKTSHEAFLAMLKLLGTEEEPTLLGEQVTKRSFSSGDESFEFANGSRIVFVARSQASGRGLSGDLVILDEAMFLTAAMMGALFPTLSARPNPLVIYASSAGLASSSVLRDVRDRGRAGDDPSLVYLEWCAPRGRCAADDCDHAKTAIGCMLDDPANWMAANPAVAAGRITLTYIAAERRALPVAEFMRERMGWWESPAIGGLFHMPDWWKSQDAQSTPGSSLSLAVHVTPDRSAASIGIASTRGDGRVHVELVKHGPGVSWVVPYVVDRCERHHFSHVVVAGGMAAGALAVDLESLAAFKPLNATDVRRACAAFYDLVKTGDQLAHRSEQDLAALVSAAVEAAARSSERGEWVFAADPGVDLSPLYVLALAAWAARSGPRQLTDDELLASAY